MIRLTVLGLIILLLAMAVTNPNQDAHRKIVYKSFAADILPMTYNNYYLLSTTTVQGQTASVGMLSHVWKMK